MATLTMMALLFFQQNNVDVAVLEVSEGGATNATAICTPKIAAVTRVTADKEEATPEYMQEVLGVVKAGTHVELGGVALAQDLVFQSEVLGITDLQ